jgi:cytochrome P450
MQELLGTLLLDPQVIEDPYPFYRQLHEQAPVWRVVPQGELFVVSSYALLEEATRRTEDFSSNLINLLYRNEDGLPGLMSFSTGEDQFLATADPPLHTLHKRAVFPDFFPKRMALLESEIVEVAGDCVDRALEQGRCDFMAEVGNMVPVTMISRLIGFRGADLNQLMQAAFDSTQMLAATMSLDELKALRARSSDVGVWIGGQLAVAAKDPGEDILTSTWRNVESGVFTPRGAVGVLHTLLSAGGESTTSLLGNAVRILAERPGLQQQLREHPEQIPAFVEEAARFEAPFRYHHRYAYRDTTLGGVDIPAGSTVLMFWGAANRDPTEFDRPDELVLDRPRRHVTFGHGIHQCVGAPLARLEARITLEALLERTRSFTLDPDQPPLWVDSLEVRRHERLPVQLVAH